MEKKLKSIWDDQTKDLNFCFNVVLYPYSKIEELDKDVKQLITKELGLSEENQENFMKYVLPGRVIKAFVHEHDHFLPDHVPGILKTFWDENRLDLLVILDGGSSFTYRNVNKMNPKELRFVREKFGWDDEDEELRKRLRKTIMSSVVSDESYQCSIGENYVKLQRNSGYTANGNLMATPVSDEYEPIDGLNEGVIKQLLPPIEDKYINKRFTASGKEIEYPESAGYARICEENQSGENSSIAPKSESGESTAKLSSPPQLPPRNNSVCYRKKSQDDS